MENKTQLILDCQWRFYLREACPYHPELLLMTKLLFYFSLFSLLFMTMVLIMRVRVQNCRILRHRNGRYTLNPQEGVFLAAWFFTLGMTIHSADLLFWQHYIPLFIRGYLYALPYSMGASLLGCYWISLIRAAPHDPSVHKSQFLQQAARANSLLGYVLLVFYFLLPFVEGLSAHFSESNPPLSRKFFFINYFSWPCLTVANWVGALVFGKKVYFLLLESIKFQKNSESIVTHQLKRVMRMIPPAVALCVGTLLAGGTSCFCLAVAGDYIWSNRAASLFFFFLLNLSIGIFSTLFYISVVLIDINKGRKQGNWIVKYSAHTTNHPEDPLSQQEEKRRYTLNKKEKHGIVEKQESEIEVKITMDERERVLQDIAGKTEEEVILEFELRKNGGSAN